MLKKWTVSVYQDGRRYAEDITVEAYDSEEAEALAIEVYDPKWSDWDIDNIQAEAYQTEEQKNEYRCPTCGKEKD